MHHRSKTIKVEDYKEQLLDIFASILSATNWDEKSLRKILALYPKDAIGFFSKDELVFAYRFFIEKGLLEESDLIEDRIRMKPTRTASGVATVTVLTKPFPCPGQCIFCPNDVKMPKSYLSDEPGAQRAERNNFDPYLQTYNRLQALQNIGHNTDKVELIVLGGTWSFYPEEYQIWFIKRCFDAMNDFGQEDQRDKVHTQNIFEEADRIPARSESGRLKTYNEIVNKVARGESDGFFTETEFASWEELEDAHLRNETAKSRNVGLVIETRPDYINEHETIKIRRLGGTKVQIGIQTMDDKIHELNRRGHGVKEIIEAIKYLRTAGFKIHAHWMPNLYGATPDGDIEDYKKLWNEDVRPDELKIYPTSIIDNTELHEIYKQGRYSPYTYDLLLKVLTETMPETPRYCRLTRVIRDIPSTDIVNGNKLTNFREIAENEAKKQGRQCQCIRCREIKAKKISIEDVEEEIIEYKSSAGLEYFISYKTKIPDDKIIGFLRLLIPNENDSKNNFIKELQNCSMIREVHVYGQVVGIGQSEDGRSQHLGIGTKLLELARKISVAHGYKEIAVISAIGTREYYRKKGFSKKGLYMTQLL